MNGALRCGTCGADWSRGDFGPSCPECGGGAMVIACPVCGGACGSAWRRAVLDSRDSQTAHWIGRCAGAVPASLQPPAP
ncbi:MAG: hypothetical protein GC201_05090 [Alphaproteobacteria bacterium]|nr:hypothetical protein [Alphaproteobacteria bacterium]